jgi:hypothetical protein
LNDIGTLPSQFVRQGLDRGVPEVDVRASDQAVNNLAQLHSPLLLGNHIQEREAASSAGIIFENPARHRLSGEAEEVVEYRRSAAGQDGMLTRFLDD